MLYPGETDDEVWIMPFAADEIAKVILSYDQNGKTAFEIEATEFTPIDEESCKFDVFIDQDTSLKLKDNLDIQIQCNVLFIDENKHRRTTEPIIIRAGKQQHREAMT